MMFWSHARNRSLDIRISPSGILPSRRSKKSRPSKFQKTATDTSFTFSNDKLRSDQIFADNPRFLGLRTAIYHGPDLAKGKAWYSKVLGIEPYFDQPFYVGFNIGGYELGLDPDPSSKSAG